MPYKTSTNGPVKKSSQQRNPYKRTFFSDHRRFGFIAIAVLTLVLLFIGGKAINRAFDKTPLFKFVAIDGYALEQGLRSTNKLSSLVILYDSNCEDCTRQIRYLEPLFSKANNGQINFILVAFNDNPNNAASYFKKFNFSQEVTPYYAGEDILKAFDKLGIRQINSLPVTALFDNRGRLVMHYPSVVTAEDIQENLNILTFHSNR